MADVIGVDFDNTVVSYDRVMQAIAVREGWLPAGQGAGKRDIRDRLRTLADGEQRWRQLQARAYGMDIHSAVLMDGARAFFSACKRRGAALYVISHKTEWAAAGDRGANLREAALAWMEEHEFFAPEGLGLSRRHVFFESTRREKVARIAALRCTHYIDDLEETFLEEGFPRATKKILYAPQGAACSLADVHIRHSWDEIHDDVFGSRD